MNSTRVELIFKHSRLLSLDLPLVVSYIQPRWVGIEFISQASRVVIVRFS